MLFIPRTIREKLPELRSKHGSIYLLDTSGFRKDELTSCVVIKPLSRREFNSFTEDYLLDPVAAVTLLVRRCVLASNLSIDVIDDDWLAGIDEYIVTAVSKISGFASEDDLIQGVQTGRQEAMTLEAAITIFICKAFPSFTPNDVDEMTFEQQMRYVSLAEALLGRPLPYEEFFTESKPKKERAPAPGFYSPDIPVPDGMISHGAPAPRNPRLNVPRREQDKSVMVTPDNLNKVMQETRDVFGRP